jgi:hypothetical protein
MSRGIEAQDLPKFIPCLPILFWQHCYKLIHNHLPVKTYRRVVICQLCTLWFVNIVHKFELAVQQYADEQEIVIGRSIVLSCTLISHQQRHCSEPCHVLLYLMYINCLLPSSPLLLSLLSSLSCPISNEYKSSSRSQSPSLVSRTIRALPSLALPIVLSLIPSSLRQISSPASASSHYYCEMVYAFSQWRHGQGCL